MKLPSFIRKACRSQGSVEAGIDECAALFDTQPGTVKAWLYRERYPRQQTAVLIAERTKDHPAGRVTLADCYSYERAQ